MVVDVGYGRGDTCAAGNEEDGVIAPEGKFAAVRAFQEHCCIGCLVGRLHALPLQMPCPAIVGSDPEDQLQFARATGYPLQSVIGRSTAGRVVGEERNLGDVYAFVAFRPGGPWRRCISSKFV